MSGTHCGGEISYLALMGIGIMSIGITGTDLPVLSMDQSFRMLVHSDGTGNGSSFSLGAGSDRCSGVTCSLDLPAALGMRCYMLVSSHKIIPFLFALTAPS